MRTLQIISLNAWGGRAIDALLPFLEQRGKDTDVFCFQEVFDASQDALDASHPGEGLRGDQFRLMSFMLPEHDAHFARHDDRPHRMSLAMFIRKGLDVREVDDFVLHEPSEPKETGSIVLSPRRLQYATLELNGKDVTIANYHGLWVNGPKTDTEERILQAHGLRGFLDECDGAKVLCGDLNLLPNTSSIRIIGKYMRNLVREHGVTCTRTPLYRHFENPDEPNYADYAFVSGADVHRFEVLPDVVSDHSPLLIEIA